jgi:hypothetical protein
MQKININGVEQIVHMFTPEINGQLAVVHLSVLQKLTDLLPKASLDTIKYRITNEIHQCSTIEEIIVLMKAEIAFQETVNCIKQVNAEEINYSSNGELGY